MREVARRVFTTPDGRDVALVIYEPVADTEAEWSASVEFIGLAEAATAAVGVDSLQAYALALRMAKARLEVARAKYGLEWEGGGDLIGDLML
jgi:hypothetical protein